MTIDGPANIRTHDEDLANLARNWRDSLSHALTHFSELRTSDYGFHNRKWIILSVSHAAEVFCNYMLKRVDPTHPKGDYPSLGRALALLREAQVWETLTPAEREVITDYLPPLRDLRNSLMHGPATERVDISFAALAVLALLFLVQRRTGLPTEEFFDQSPRIELDVLDELRITQLKPYTEFVERIVLEDVGGTDERQAWLIGYCESCGGHTVIRYEFECRACFHEARLEDDD